MYDKTMANLAMIRARQGPIIALATEGDKAIKKVADDVIYLPKALEPIYPILATVPLQLSRRITSHVARGCDVDKLEESGEERDFGGRIEAGEFVVQPHVNWICDRLNLPCQGVN